MLNEFKKTSAFPAMHAIFLANHVTTPSVLELFGALQKQKSLTIELGIPENKVATRPITFLSKLVAVLKIKYRFL